MVWRSIGTVGVDTGSLLITDPAYLSGEDGNEVFDDCAVVRLANHGAEYDGSVLGNRAVVLPTGYGDGQYQVFANIVDDDVPNSSAKRIAAIHIQFIEEDQA